MLRPLAASLAFALALIAAPAAHADRAGSFDFYVLSLSWSPSYCEAEGRDANRAQCASGRPFAFVVHGLWPQYERGWPQDCQTRYRTRLSRDEVSHLLDIMPSQNLIFHEWRKHGTCTGLAPDAYFTLLRNARDKVRIPPAFDRIEKYVMVSPGAVESAFRKANPGLDGDEIAVTCDRRRLREVRICFTRDLEFRACPEIDRKACRNTKVVLPPIRGGQ
ncbi:MAG: ribonuclease T [Hyphomicrobiales bacterium]|nr:MAG: ribonuclease T [Hyphomicrobiales bacterium]